MKLKVGDKVRLTREAADRWLVWLGKGDPVGYVCEVDCNDSRLPYLIGTEPGQLRTSEDTRWFHEGDVSIIRDGEKGEFIIWSPTSTKPPKDTYFTYKQARYVARKMAEEYGETFYVLEARCKYINKTEVIKEEL